MVAEEIHEIRNISPYGDLKDTFGLKVGAQPFPLSARISTLLEKKTENRPNNYIKTPQCIYLIIKMLNLTYAADKGDHDLQIDARLDYVV